MEPTTLVAPDGREYVTSSPAEVNDLTIAHGYITLKQKNDQEKAEARKAKADEEKKDESKGDNPVPAKQDSGHTPSTDSK